MQNPLQTDHAKDSFLLLARVAIGVYFLLAGYAKIAGGVGAFVEHATPNIPSFLSPQIGKLYLQMLPFAEMIVGVAMVIGLYTRVAGALMSLMLISFMIAATGIGFKAKPGEPPQIDKNLIFLGLTLLITHLGGGKVAVDQSMGKAPGPTKK